MHEHKMLHLDLKPGNVVLDDKGNAVLIDFGLSKQYDENGQPESSTTVGGGTPGYAPLEQANYRDGKDFPVTMDIYALGATMFKMLTGTRAPEASAILNDGFPTYMLSSVCDSKGMVACIERAMSPKKKDRYQTVKELLGDVAKCSMSQSSKNKETVCEVPVINDGGYWGYYETIEGEAEYGTEKIVKNKVTAHIPVPEKIKITKEDRISGVKYYVMFSKNEHDESYISIIDSKGEKKNKGLSKEIYDDIMDYLKKNGFFSPIHWERESSTWSCEKNLVCITFEYNGGVYFSRQVLATNHFILRRAVDGLLFNTSLGKEIAQLLPKDDFEPDDILRREETIYGGPPIDEQKENTGDKEDENGFLSNLLFLLAIGLHCIYPAIWCLTFLTNNYSYPNLWSVGTAWVVGVFLGIAIITKGRDRDRLICIGLWSLLIIESVIVYFVNYI